MKRLFRSSAAAILAVVTFATCFRAGSAFSGSGDPANPWQAAVFAAAIMVALGAHACGHYVASRRGGVEADLPYFIPAFSLSGTSGVYVKLRWPIDDARTIARIFVAGPIAGFTVSSLLYFAGLPMSTVVPISADQLTLGDSLLTAVAQRLVFPRLPADHGLMLHPAAMAGYFGFYFNLWQLLPVGRFDAGRVVYAAFGYRRSVVISWATIGILTLLAAFSVAWLAVAMFGSLTMIRIARQHTPNAMIQPLDTSAAYRLLAMFGILVLTFVPVPVRVGP